MSKHPLLIYYKYINYKRNIPQYIVKRGVQPLLPNQAIYPVMLNTKDITVQQQQQQQQKCCVKHE